MRPLRAPLIVIDCRSNEADFRWRAASAEALSDQELAVCVLWCIEAVGIHELDAPALCEEFAQTQREIQAEWELRWGDNPVRMEMILYAARDQNPHFSGRFNKLASVAAKLNAEETKRLDDQENRSLVGKLISHEKHGVGRIKKYANGWFHVDFLHLSGIRLVPPSHVKEWLMQAGAHAKTQAPIGPNNAA